MAHVSGSVACTPYASVRNTTVLFISDVRLYREALVIGMTGANDIAVTGHCSGAEALEWLGRTQVDVALVDASLSAGLSLARQIRASFPTVRILGLAIGSESERILDCAEAGISSYLDRNAGIYELVTAVGSVMRGELSCTPRVAGMLFERLATLADNARAETTAAVPSDADPADKLLTLRETEVAELIDTGLTNKQIALELRISMATVKNHVHNILEKLEVPRRAAIRGRLASTRKRGAAMSSEAPRQNLPAGTPPQSRRTASPFEMRLLLSPGISQS